MNNKKGFLLGETVLKIIIAVICIVFLDYFLSALYFSKVNAEKREQAKQTLLGSVESISIFTGEVVAGEIGGSKQYEVKNPAGWYLFTFFGKEKKPNSCAGQTCLCICDNVVDVFDRQLGYCEEGICLIGNFKGEYQEIKINYPEDGLTNILIKKEQGEKISIAKI